MEKPESGTVVRSITTYVYNDIIPQDESGTLPSRRFPEWWRMKSPYSDDVEPKEGTQAMRFGHQNKQPT